MDSPSPTIAAAMAAYLEAEKNANAQTGRTYGVALKKISHALIAHGLDPASSPPHRLTPEIIPWIVAACKGLEPSTEQLYITVAVDFLKYLSEKDIHEVNLVKVRAAVKRHARQAGDRIPFFPRESIETLIQHALDLRHQLAKDERDWFINLRDGALIITLADTGLRIHEACKLRRGDLDFEEHKAVVIGKGNQQAIVRFSERSIEAIRVYLRERGKLDGATGKPLSSLPVFARHDRGAGKRVLAITPTTGRDIFERRVRESLGEEAVGTVTPHSFRHYFVTVVLNETGNLHTAKEFARHKNIGTTEKYTHIASKDLDRDYRRVFNKG